MHIEMGVKGKYELKENNSRWGTEKAVIVGKGGGS